MGTRLLSNVIVYSREYSRNDMYENTSVRKNKFPDHSHKQHGNVE